jgi:hypothetical protein
MRTNDLVTDFDKDSSVTLSAAIIPLMLYERHGLASALRSPGFTTEQSY